eukprot:sb/3475671/
MPTVRVRLHPQSHPCYPNTPVTPPTPVICRYKTPTIQNAHGESEITAMVIDLPTKMLSGSSDGTIKIWDINTTACHRVLQAGLNGPVDILQVISVWRRHTPFDSQRQCAQIGSAAPDRVIWGGI